MPALTNKKQILDKCSSKQAAANLLLARVLKRRQSTIIEQKLKDEELTKSEIALLSFKIDSNGHNGKL